MKRTILIILGFTAFVTTSCYYDKEDILYGTACDTSNTNYSVTVTGILGNYECLNCHIGGNPSGGINLQNYADVKAYVDNGKLYGSVSHSSGFIPMPDGAAKISACDLRKVKAWIDAGALNN